MLRTYYVNNQITSTLQQIPEQLENYLIFTEGNYEKSFLVVFEPEEENTFGYVVKFSFSDALPIKKIYNKKLSQRLDIEAVVEGITIKISSDEDSFDDPNFYSGIIFLTDDSLLSYTFPEEITKKYYIFPSAISVNDRIEILLRIRLKDFKSVSYFSSFSKDSFSVKSDINEYLFAYSRIYYTFLSQNPNYIAKINFLGINELELFPIVKQEFLRDIWPYYISSESYFYSLFPINGILEKNFGYFESNINLERSQQFYNYSLSRNSYYIYTRFYMRNSDGKIFTTLSGSLSAFDYLKQLVYATSLEMTFPIGLVNLNRNTNITNLMLTFSNLANYAISRGGSFPLTFNTSGPSSSNTSLNVGKSLSQILFMYGKIFEGYVRKNYSALTGSSDFTNMVNNLNNLKNLSSYGDFFDVSLQELEDKIYDLSVLYSLPIYLYTFFSMRNLLPENQIEYWKYWATLYYRFLISNNTLLTINLPVDVNSYSTESSTLTNTQKESLISLVLFDSLKSMAFSNYISSLSESFLDFVMCTKDCTNEYLSKNEFKKLLIPSDVVQNIFNVLVEKTSCRFGDTLVAIESGTCSDIGTAVQSTYVDFFNKRLFGAAIHNISFPNEIEIKVSAETF